MRTEQVRKSGGVSLLEALLAVIIMGIFYSIVAGMGWNPLILGLEQEARHLATDLRWAQHRSIHRRVNHYIELDINKDSYRIIIGEENEVEVLRERELREGVTLEGITLGEPVFHFTPTGAPSRGNSIILREGNKRGRVITAVGTGRIRISISGEEG